MRFYLAEDLGPELVLLLRQGGVDVTSAREGGNQGVSLTDALNLAARQGRALLTRSRYSYILLTVSAFEALAPHAGVLIAPYRLTPQQYPSLVEALKRYDESHPDGMQPYAIDFLSLPG